jgi:two-component system cell cycle response regulator
VVDSSRSFRVLVSRALASESGTHHVEVTAVASGREALEHLSHEHYDVVTSALLLPDMYGYDLCRDMRGMADYRLTPFVVLTGEPQQRHMKEGFEAGVTDYYDKNLGFAGFNDFIHGLMLRYTRMQGRVLYVEDSRTEAAVMVPLLERHGLEVLRARSAEQALALVDDSIDLVVTDFTLEGELSGGDFLHNLRCGLRRPRELLPVLVLTGESDPHRQAQILHAGGNDFIQKPVVEDVLIARLRALLMLRRQCLDLRRQADELKRLSDIDLLTGVYNRRYLLEKGGQLLASAGTRPLWVAVLAVDDFATINEQYGHVIGDRVLQAVGQVLRDSIQSGDLVARTAAGEFVLILRHRTQEECMSELDALRASIEALRPSGVDVTASIGVATSLNRPDADFDHIVVEADQVMSRARESGSNRVFISGLHVRAPRGLGRESPAHP